MSQSKTPPPKPFAEHFKIFARKFNIPNPVTERDVAEYEGVVQTFYAGALAMMAVLDGSNDELQVEPNLLHEMMEFANSQTPKQKPAANEPLHAPLKLVDPVAEELQKEKVRKATGFDDLESLYDISDPNVTS